MHVAMTTTSLPRGFPQALRHNSGWTRRGGFGSPFIQSIADHTDVLMGVAAGGLTATAGGIGYYMYQRGQMQRILGKTDWVKIERAEKGSLTLPLPVISFIGWAMLAAITALYSRTKANLDVNFRQLVSRVNYSLNTVVDGKLTFRTIQEKSLEQVLLNNSAAISLVKQATKRVTEKDPFLKFPPSYNFFMMNSILNDLSSLSAIGFFQADR